MYRCNSGKPGLHFFMLSLPVPASLKNIKFGGKQYTMGLLTPKGKKNEKKGSAVPKNAGQGSKFMPNKNSKAAGFAKKPMTGGSQRGS